MPDELLGKIAEGYAKINDFDIAINTTENIKEISIKAKNLTNIASLEIELGNKERANKLLNESLQAIASLEIDTHIIGAFVVYSRVKEPRRKKSLMFDKGALLAAIATE